MSTLAAPEPRPVFDPAPSTMTAPHPASDRRPAAAPEWPTWALIVVIYGCWGLAARHSAALGPWAGHAALIVATCWFMSLQHELLHGHPTRSRRLNRLLGLAPLAVWYPYDIYRSSHIEHHQDDNLTHPGIDPESNYVDAATYARLPPLLQRLRVLQRTVLGRVLLGPALVIVPTWLEMLRKPWRGDFSQTRCWLEHLGLLALLLWALQRWAGIGPLDYVLAVGYPAMGLAMLRSFYEHRPAATPAHRIVINEAAWPWRVLYLNNNYHSVHHEDPALPWYRIRATYLADRAGFLERNGAFLVPGYGHLLRRFALRAIDSPVLSTGTRPGAVPGSTARPLPQP